MSEKSELYNQLKEIGVEFPKPYVSLTVAELEQLATDHFSRRNAEMAQSVTDDDLSRAWAEANAAIEDEDEDGLYDDEELFDFPETVQSPPITPPTVPSGQPIPQPQPVRTEDGRPAETLEELVGVVTAMFRAGVLKEGREVPYRNYKILVKNKGEDRAGLSFSAPEDKPLRIDDVGRIWFLDEVAKPAIPRARMTRKTRYIDTGVKEERTYDADGKLDEIFEVAGSEHRELTTTVTLPSWQVGKYRDIRMPFSIYVYNGRRGFSFEEINSYFGGLDFVPPTIKAFHVGQQLCYDITTTRTEIESQFNQIRRPR